MISLNSIRISTKLPILVVALCIFASSMVATFGYLDLKKNMLEHQRRTYELLVSERIGALDTWLDKVSDDVLYYATNPTVVSAVGAFSSSYNLMIDSEGLQQAYVTDNPNPAGEKDKLDQAPQSVPYHFQHGSFHPFFRKIKDVEGYYDVFLFNLDGDLIYSVFKESDYATNFDTGVYSASGLGHAYRAARDGLAGELYFADFESYAPSANIPASFLATQVVNDQGAVIGVVAVQLPSDQINAIVRNPEGLSDTGELYLVGADGQTRSASRFSDGHRMLANASHLVQTDAVSVLSRDFFYDVDGINGHAVIAEVSSLEVFGNKWGVIAEMDMTELMAPVVSARNKMLAVGALVCAVAAVAGWLVARSVTQPLQRLRMSMKSVSERNYADEIADRTRGDEVGDLCSALVDFRDKLMAADHADAERETVRAQQTRVVERLSTALTNLADGNLSQQIQTPFFGDYDQLRQDYNRTIENLNLTIGAVVESTSGIFIRSDQMSKSSDDLSRRTENQAATLEQTAAALDELTASVRSAASGAKEVEIIVARAQADADASEAVVGKAVSAMTEIEKSSDEISQIIGVIDDIAFQTNLLALNAGVEAARAGDAGRGFAVVASEVRALAQRSSDAAKKIKILIGGSSEQVGRGVALVGETGEVLTKIAGNIAHINSLMIEIAAGAEEQSVGLGEINIGVTQLDKVTQQNAAMVEEATVNSHALKTDLTHLAQIVKKFKLSKQGSTSSVRREEMQVDDVNVFSSAHAPKKRRFMDG